MGTKQAIPVGTEAAGAILRHARYSLGRQWPNLSRREQFWAVALSVRDLLVERMLETAERYDRADPKRLAYLSIEYLPGRSLAASLYSLGLREAYRETLAQWGIALADLEEVEEDAALGNGGLGRLASCFLDSLATLAMPACGYGINYEYGLFRQEIDDGYQRERPDNWLASGTPWQIARPEDACFVPLYGRIAHETDRRGGYNPVWMDWRILVGIPHDVPVPGYGGHTVNCLRLFSARASRDFDMQIFNDGDYFRAVEQKVASENISKVLYPSDARSGGRELRLVQEYFLVACAIRDAVRGFLRHHDDLHDLPRKLAVQLNDTHPALAVAELMRLLIDEKDLEWDDAWSLTQATLAFTNHTLAAEALETWPAPLLELVLPRHLQIIQEIDRRFRNLVLSAYPDDFERWQRMAIVADSDPPHVRMTNLAIAGCHSVNGVSAIHSELVGASLAPDFHELWPERFNNKTNGITQRRWLLQANPGLADLITRRIGDGWIVDLTRLKALEEFADDAQFRAEFASVKRANKERLAKLVLDTLRLKLNPDSLFDVQVKRIHVYKRQLLNVLHIVGEYLALVEERRTPPVPRTYLFAGKAAPGYWFAKQVIKLIHCVGRIVNNDRRAADWMQVVFLPDYRVSLAEKIIPAADLSEQISTAGSEASGTSNMKLALNGALTIGTPDGANLEIFDEVGEDSAFPFGLTAPEVRALRLDRSYRPGELYRSDARLLRIAAALASPLFCPQQPDLLNWAFQTILDPSDEHFHLADLPPYLAAQERAGRAFQDRDRWTRMAIHNVAHMGKFSSDRTVAEYAREIWDIRAVHAK